MVQFVKTTQLVTANGVSLTSLDFTTGLVGAQTRDIPCSNTDIVGAFWRIPIVEGPKVAKYEYVQAVNATPPTLDSLKVLRVKHLREEYEMAIINTDYVTTIDEFARLCDGLGGTLAVMPTVTIPFPIFQNGPVSTNSTTGANTFLFPFPLNPLALQYAIPNPVFNGTAPTPAYAPSGITTAAGFVTWANSNWSTYGTWTSSGNIVTLVSPTSGTFVTAAGLSVALAPALWCLDLTSFSAGQNVNGMEFGTGTVIALPAFVMNNTNYNTVIAAIQPHFENGAIFTQTVTNKITISTVSAVLKLLNNASVVATATAGTC